jgi:predicted  nucleic acid-binding Zn-ribbon protein
MNQKLEGFRTGIEAEIVTVTNELTKLRGQKKTLADQIRDKVAELAELRSALARMTPRTRKAKDDVTAEEAAVA